MCFLPRRRSVFLQKSRFLFLTCVLFYKVPRYFLTAPHAAKRFGSKAHFKKIKKKRTSTEVRFRV